MYRGRIKNIHFVGIGGIGMSGIAEVLLNLGYKISGSDLRASEMTERLERLGATISIGHRVENVSRADVVVYSSAVRSANPEIVSALEHQIPVITRAEMLAELMRMKYGIAVAGTHGKTTTTSMIAAILGYCGIDPTIVIGGRVNSIGSNARAGKGEYLVAEADESDGSFIKLSPTIAVVTGIDPEHMDHYCDMEEVKAAYLGFINKVPFYGCAVLCLDHPNIQSLLPNISRRYMTYGLTVQSDITARGLSFDGMDSIFTVWFRDRKMGKVRIGMPGEHNVYNALAAITVALELDMDFESIIEGMRDFGGVQRRFQIKGIVNDIVVIDDYGHHPQEIKATLKAAKNGWGRRTVAVFQPHRYTRTRDLFSEFLSAFNDADELILTDLYPAGEEAIDGAASYDLYRAIKEHGHRNVAYYPNKDDIPGYLAGSLKSGDMVVTLGAGDVWQVSDNLLKMYGEQTPRSPLWV